MMNQVDVHSREEREEVVPLMMMESQTTLLHRNHSERVSLISVYSAIREVFCIKPPSSEDDHHDGNDNEEEHPTRSIIVGSVALIWTLLMLAIFTGLMGQGVFTMVMIEMPIPAVFTLSAYGISRYCCRFVPRALLIQVAFVVTGIWAILLDTDWFHNFDFLYGWTLFWLISGGFYALHWLMQKMVRSLERQTREQDPSLAFWLRLDNCLVRLIRCIGALIFVGYVSFLIMLLIESIPQRLSDTAVYFLVATLSFGSLFYFVVATLAVRDRPNWRLHVRNCQAPIQRARQLVLNPDDPLAEPLLLV